TPPSLNPMADKRAAEALALVQTHRALGYPTILQAMNEHVRSMKQRGRGVRLGEWRVNQADGDLYEIRVQLRDEGEKGQWFEGVFMWHAGGPPKKVTAGPRRGAGPPPKPPDLKSPAPKKTQPPLGPTSG